MRIKVWISVSVVVGIVVGSLVTGSWFYLKQNDEGNRDRNFTRSASKPQSTGIVLERSYTSNDSTNTTSQSKAPQLTRVQSLLEITNLESDFDQSASLYLLVSQANLGDLERYISQAQSITSLNQRGAALSIIFQRFAALNPNSALDRALNLEDTRLATKSNLVRSVFNEWSVSDLDSAIEATHELSNQMQRVAAYAIMWRMDGLESKEIAEISTRLDPNGTLNLRIDVNSADEFASVSSRESFIALVQENSVSPQHYRNVSMAAQKWIDDEGLAILEELYSAISDDNIKNRILTDLLNRVLHRGDMTFKDIFDTVTNFSNIEDAKSATEHVLMNLSYTHPKQSYEWVMGLNKRIASRYFRDTMLAGWSRRKPEEVLNNLDSIPFEFQQTAIVKALGTIADNNPQAAIRHLSSLDSEQIRAAAIEEIATQWSLDDGRAAFEWQLSETPLDEYGRVPHHLSYTAERYVQQDLQSAIAHANGAEGDLKEMLENKVATHLINSDIDQAIDYIGDLKDLDLQRELHLDIARQIIRVDSNSQRAIRYGSELPKDQQGDYFTRMVSAWSTHDPLGLFEEYNRLPKSTQPWAARRLIQEHEDNRMFTESQVRDLQAIADTGEKPWH